MPAAWFWVPIGFAAVAVVVLLMWHPCQVAAREAHLIHARKEFHKQREWLEVKFIALAGSRVKPDRAGEERAKADGPRWANCEFDDAVSYVRHRTSAELRAFVAVTVALEDVSHLALSTTDLMSNVQAGTAVFRFEKDRWVTDGQVIMNLSPSEAIRFYQSDLEVVGQEMAYRPV